MIQWIPPTVKSYERFVGAVESVPSEETCPQSVKKTIHPRNQSCTVLFKEFQSFLTVGVIV